MAKTKTIHFERTRKLNPALVSKKFEYMSETVTFGGWLDVDEDGNLLELTKELKDYVNKTISDEVEVIIEHYRKIGRADYVYYNQIENALYQLLINNGASPEEAENAFVQFKTILEAEMAKETV